MKGGVMEFEEKAKIRIEHWLNHTAGHIDGYRQLAEELENTGYRDIARHIRATMALTASCAKCLEGALLSFYE